jgi:hypothetical protein
MNTAHRAITALRGSVCHSFKYIVVMRKILLTKSCFLFIASLYFSNCKKDVTPSTSVNIILYDKPLSVIQQNIEGKWKLIYGKGGIATTTQYYDNDFWEFNNNRIKILDKGNLDADTIILWNYDLGTYTNGDSTFLMKFYDAEYVPWVYVVDKIYNDTLILHDNSSDAFFYHFIKSN